MAREGVRKSKKTKERDREKERMLLKFFNLDFREKAILREREGEINRKRICDRVFREEER